MHSKKQLQRYSVDTKPLNSHGFELIDLCRSSGLLIVNGRCGDDRGIGGYTRIDTTRSSIVDYVMANPRLFKSFESFTIHGKLPESDHLPISFSIQCLPQTKERHTSAGIIPNEWQPQTKFLSCESDLTTIKHAFTDSDGQSALKNFNDSLADLGETNQVALALNNYISQTIARVCRSCRPKTKKIKNGPRWFDNRCRQLRSEAVRAGERVMCETDRENLITKC